MIFSFSFYYTNKSALTKIIDKLLHNINMKCIFCVNDDIASTKHLKRLYMLHLNKVNVHKYNIE